MLFVGGHWQRVDSVWKSVTFTKVIQAQCLTWQPLGLTWTNTWTAACGDVEGSHLDGEYPPIFSASIEAR